MKHIIISIISLFIAIPLVAQHYPHDVPHYFFVDYNKNHIKYDGDSSKMEAFFDKLDELIFDGEGIINIVHIGGSHIQAGVWSREMREQFAQFAPGLQSSRGLIFPYNIAQSNSPYDYSTKYNGSWQHCKNTQKNKDCNLGLLGYATTTTDINAKIRLHTNGNDDYMKFYFNKVKVFHETDSTSYNIVLQNADSSTTRRIDTAGGYTEFIFPHDIDTVQFAFEKTDPSQTQFKLMGFNLEKTQKAGIYYHGVGVNGADIPAYLRSPQFEKQLIHAKPDLVVLSIGINDAYNTTFSKTLYKENYRQLIKRIQSVSPETAILFTTNNDSYYKQRYVNKNGLLVKEALEELSKELGAGVWDMFSVMGGLNSINTWVKHQLASTDKIHFKRPGYVLLGNLTFEALIKSYQYHLLKKYEGD